MNPYETITQPEKLYFLYESTASQIEKLKNLMDKNLENTLNELYRLKLIEAETNMQQIKTVIEARMQGECVSIEQVLMRNEGGQTSIVIWLKKETQSHELLGDSVTGNVLMSYKEMNEHIQNIRKEVHSYGNIRIQPTQPLNYTENQLDHLQNVGIETCEMLEVW